MKIEKQHYNLMRKTIGWLVIALPIAPILFALIGHFLGQNPDYWWTSISATYYTNSDGIFVSILAIAGFFFCLYPGYDWRDRLVNVLTGAGLLGLIFFPCGYDGLTVVGLVGLFCIPAKISGYIHMAFSVIVFASLFVNIRFLFTIGYESSNPQKKKRNLVYKITAYSIPALLPVMLAGAVFPKFHILILVYEILTLVIVGFAWLVKADFFKYFRDK